MSTDLTDPFLVACRDLGFLRPDQLADVVAWARGNNADTQAIAREVGRRGWLTNHQIKEIYWGRGAELFLGPYVLLEQIGEGGMGRVFKARHTRLGRDVAVKVIRKEKLSKPVVLQRFKQEIRAVAQLSHPNVVLAFDADEYNGVHYYAMEFVEGGDLTKLVRQFGPVPTMAACDYIRQAALGLQHAYERGLVHRDIKPSNLLVTPRGQVKVLDLGLAMLKEPDGQNNANRVTHDGYVLGTPDFLAPEQAQNPHGVDIRADIYSLGTTLFYILTGRVPFEGPSPTDKLIQHVSAPVPSMLPLRPDIPPQLDQIVQWLMAKRPEDRPQTPAQVAAVLQPFCPAPSGPVPVSSHAGYPTHPAAPSQPPAQVQAANAPTVTLPAQQFPAPPAPGYDPAYAPAPPGYAPAPPGPAAMPGYDPAFAPAEPHAFAPPAPGYAPGYAPAPDPAFTPTTGHDEPIGRRYQPKPSGGFPIKFVLIGGILFFGMIAMAGMAYFLYSVVTTDSGSSEPLSDRFTNSFGVEMVKLNSGTFTMGSPDDEPGRSGDEGPRNSITITQPFYIATTEITNSQYSKVMGNAPSFWLRKLRQGVAEKAPVESVTYASALAYCKALNQKDKYRRKGWTYRLPTEAEWEYACRAGTTSTFPSGPIVVFEKDAIFDWKKELADKTGLGEVDASRPVDMMVPHPVTDTTPNAWGLYGMSGNVWEWCSDYYEGGYDNQAKEDPTGPADGVDRVIRGGSYLEPANQCRCATRRGVPPDTKKNDIGLRIVFAPVKGE